jgi:hypothetical protein
MGGEVAHEALLEALDGESGTFTAFIHGYARWVLQLWTATESRVLSAVERPVVAVTIGVDPVLPLVGCSREDASVGVVAVAADAGEIRRRSATATAHGTEPISV